MPFEFATATRIIFGAGVAREVAPLAFNLGRQCLLVVGGKPERATWLANELRARGVEPVGLSVAGEPTVATVIAGVKRAREAHCDLVIGLGGGSVLDTGKAIAALLTNPGDPLDYLEVVGKGKALAQAAAPFIAMPTTAGTGTEVTRNAVLCVPEARVKVSLRSPLMLPRVAVIDPELMYTLPPAITASTGLDALAQLIEPFVCNAPNPITDLVCGEGIRRVARALLPAYRNGRDATAREDMALASLFGGLALANAKLGAVHGFAGVLGGMFNAPHGALCARLLPNVMEANGRALRQRAPDAPALARYDQIARLVTGEPGANIADAVGWVRALSADLNIAPLAQFGVTRADFPTVVAQAQKASSMKGNPIALTNEELAQVLMRSV